MAERFRIADLDVFGTGRSERLVRRKSGGELALLPEADIRLLSSCGEYRTLDEHAGAWAVYLDQRKIRQAQQRAPRWLARLLEFGVRAVPPAALVEQTRAALSALAEKGLLLPLSTLLPEMLAHGPDDPPRPIGALGFTTRRRVPELRRALDSYAANLRQHERSPDIVVIDDSRSLSDEAETAAMLEDFARASGLPVRFAGLAERERFAEALARAARVHPDVARFALLGDERCPVTTGSARNSLLLDCVSERYVLADDDGLCRLTPAPGAEEGVSLVSKNDPTQFWFYESRDALHSSVRFTEEPDLFGLHEALLGRSVARSVAGGDLVFDASPELERRLRTLGGAIRTTMAGVVGDSGVASTVYLQVEPNSRGRLTASESFYRAAVENRQMLRVPQRTSVSDGFLTMAGNLGVDASSLFPPFPPVQRNSDGITGRLLQSCFPGSCRGYLNWAVLHDPIQARSQNLDAWFEEVRSIRFADVLTVLLRDAAPEWIEDPAAALASAGRRLTELAAASPGGFREELRRRLAGREAARIAQLREEAGNDVPAFYRALRERYLEEMTSAVVRDEYLSPRDLPGGSLGLAQELVGRVGELLSAWPRLWSAAEWLRLNGRRLSNPLA